MAVDPVAPVAPPVVDPGPVLKRPDITPAQIVSGIPILADLLHTFGLYSLSAGQIDSLEKATVWALGLLGADAVIRFGRSLGARVR
jgi:hypothetical protein